MAETNDAVHKPRDCILFSTADWSEPYWTNKQHTARILAQRGWRVLYIESVGLRSPKLGSARDWKRIWRRLWSGLRSFVVGPPQREHGVWVLSPLMFPSKHHLPIVRKFNQAMLRWTLSRFAGAHRFSEPLVWTYHPFMLEGIAALDRGPLVYHCVDDLAAIPGVDVAAFERAEHELLARSEAVFTTAAALEARCSQHNGNTHFFANVADAAHFGRAMQPGVVPADLAAIPEPRIIYHGVLSDFKVDFQLILDAAKARPDWHWIFIGEEREGQRSAFVPLLSQLPNVHFLGYRSYEQLPDYLRGMNVGLLPTLLNDYTRSMFPMKFYEYLAAGLPVVSTPLDFAREPLAGLKVGGDLDAFLHGVSVQLERGRLNADEVRAAVGDNTWERRLEKMLAIIFHVEEADVERA
ncbi:glycosyltransferase [Paraburkholderia sp.]|uniref:glycosyltransferase n=1 Tax=Paraburkholderia sp. TaxID=1926495 RepID=UPI00239A15BF|nr:glycosyltransferase [Paraburkholderia sp.]MDE1182992.1 glycosyltransferase [Paraburkholderia sp.]